MALSVLVFSCCVRTSLTQHPLLEKVQFISGQSLSQSPEECMVVGGVVEHEQHSCQELIGHQEVVQICPLVVPAAVAATPFHQWPEVLPVSGQKDRQAERLTSEEFKGQHKILSFGSL